MLYFANTIQVLRCVSCRACDITGLVTISLCVLVADLNDTAYVQEHVLRSICQTEIRNARLGSAAPDVLRNIGHNLDQWVIDTIDI